MVSAEKKRCILQCLDLNMTWAETCKKCHVSPKTVSAVVKERNGVFEPESSGEIAGAAFTLFKEGGRPDAAVMKLNIVPELSWKLWVSWIKMAELDYLPEEVKQIATIRVRCHYCGEDVVFDLRNPAHRRKVLAALHHTDFIHDECKEEERRWDESLKEERR